MTSTPAPTVTMEEEAATGDGRPLVVDGLRPHLDYAAGPAYQAPSSFSWSDPCTVGGTVRVTVTANLQLIPFLPFINSAIPGKPTLQGRAEMRVERCPTT